MRTSSKNSEAAQRWSAGAAFALSDVVSAVAAAAKAARRPLCALRRLLERGARCCGGRRIENAATSPANSKTASAAVRCVERGIVESEQPVFEQSGVERF